MESINDILNDSVDIDSFDMKLQSILNGQDAILSRIAEIEKQQTTLNDKIALLDEQRVGKLADGSQNTTVLDEHSKATNELFRR